MKVKVQIVSVTEANPAGETLELAVLERDENAPTPHEMYRAAHTLAGISATVGITPVNHLGHALEHALLRRDHSAHPGSLEALGVIRQAVGEVELMLSAIAQHYTPSEPQLLIATLDDLYPVTTVPVPAPSALPPAALSPEHPADEALEPAPVLAPTPDAEAVTPALASCFDTTGHNVAVYFLDRERDEVAHDGHLASDELATHPAA